MLSVGAADRSLCIMQNNPWGFLIHTFSVITEMGYIILSDVLVPCVLHTKISLDLADNSLHIHLRWQPMWCLQMRLS